jgi:hypothetical protein
MSVLDIFKKPAKTADQLRAKLAEIERQLPAFRLLVDATEKERAAGLLSLADREVEAIEARLARAKRDLDRATAATEEISRQLADAERREAAERLDDIKREAETIAASTANDVLTIYRELGGKVVQALEAAARIDEKIREANRQLREGGRTEVVETVADRVALRSAAGITLDVLASTSLAPLGHSGWGQARRDAERLGVVAAE